MKVDPAKAAAAGLDAGQVGQFVGLVLNGMPAGTLITEAGPAARRDHSAGAAAGAGAGGTGVDQVAGLVLAGAGGIVPLSSGGRGHRGGGADPGHPHRRRARRSPSRRTATSGNVGQTSGEVSTVLEGLTLPEGVALGDSGRYRADGRGVHPPGHRHAGGHPAGLRDHGGTFRSLLNPLILLVSIPFAAVGAVVLLLVTGTSLGMASLIGLLMLIGIVVTNAIVLLDLIEQFRDQGMDARTAVVEGARRRLRPILMTAAATILALTPMALGIGEGSFLSRPLAVVVIGGLVSSTLLTLILVPVVYLTVDRLRRRPQVAPPTTA